MGISVLLYMEPEYLTVQQIAKLIAVSPNTVTRLFEKRKGVLLIGHEETDDKRRYRSLRIPRAVYEAAVREWTVR